MCQSLSFLHCFFSFLFCTLFTLPSFPLLPVCPALLCLSATLSDKEYSCNLFRGYSPLESMLLVCVTVLYLPYNLLFFLHLCRFIFHLCNPIDDITLIYIKDKTGLVVELQQWMVLCVHVVFSHFSENLLGGG